MSTHTPIELNDLHVATITQLLREALRRLGETGDGNADVEQCLMLAKRIEALLANLGVDRD